MYTSLVARFAPNAAGIVGGRHWILALAVILVGQEEVSAGVIRDMLGPCQLVVAGGSW